MAQRKPLQILIVGKAKEENKNTLVGAIKQSDHPSPIVYNMSDTNASLKVLSDNTQHFDAVYFTYDSLDTFIVVDSFVSAAKSIRRKNGPFILADISDGLNAVVNETARKKQLELEIELNCWDKSHAEILNICREKKQQKDEIKEFADLVKKSLEEAAAKLEEEVKTMKASLSYRWTSSKDVTVDRLLTSLQTAAKTFSLTMSNEEAKQFSEACSEFSGLSSVMYSNHEKQSRFIFWLILAITVLACVVLFASIGVIGLISAGVVALGALALMVASSLKVSGYNAESDIIKTSSKVRFETIGKNKLFDFGKDASGLLLFKPERKEEEVAFHDAVEATPELQSLLSS